MKKALVTYDVQEDFFRVRIYENRKKTYDSLWHDYFDNVVKDLYDFFEVEPQNIDIDFTEYGTKNFTEWGLGDVKESKVKLMSTLVEMMNNFNKCGIVATDYAILRY